MSADRTHDDPLTVHSPLAETYARVLEALGPDAIVRDEEDGVGRFAGTRTIVLQGRNGDRLILLRGSWGELKKRIEEPMLILELSAIPAGTQVKISGEAPADPTAVEKIIGAIGDVLSIALTIGLLAYAVNKFRGLDVDWMRLALIASGGAIAYVIFKKFMGESEEDLQGAAWLRAQVRSALSPEDAEAPAAADDGAQPDGAPDKQEALRATVDD